MHAKDVPENMSGTITQNNFTVYKSRLKDALHIVDLVEDRQAIRHENKVFAAGLSFPARKRTFERKKFAFRETRGAFKQGDWQGQSDRPREAQRECPRRQDPSDAPRSENRRAPPPRGNQ